MEDILMLAPSRWQPRSVITTMSIVLEELGLAQHPDKRATTLWNVALTLWSSSILLRALGWSEREPQISDANSSNLCL